jgi:phosphoserine phosphatase
LLKAAGTSIAFEPKTESVKAAARHAVQGNLTHVLLHLPITAIAA